jgi:hypothetical protein
MRNLVVPCPGSNVNSGDATEDGKALAALALGMAGRGRKPVRPPTPSCHDTANGCDPQSAKRAHRCKLLHGNLEISDLLV